MSAPVEREAMSAEVVLEVEGLVVLTGRAGAPALVDGVGFEVASGRTLALVGESGSGKSLTALAILGLLPPPLRMAAGDVRFRGWKDAAPASLAAVGGAGFRRARGAGIGMIFQEPVAALDPVVRVGDQIAESLRRHRRLGRAAARRAAVRLLSEVGVDAPALRARAFAHELSGGQAQRAMIAMALATGPRLLVADEPTTALDGTTQHHVLQLLRDRRAATGMAMLLVTHDPAVVAAMADDTVVMHGGRVVERAGTAALFEAPRHPYTAALLAAAPRLGAPGGGSAAAPSGARDPRTLAGCRFHDRCPLADARCEAEVPALRDDGQGRSVACHRAEEEGPAPRAAADDDEGGVR